MLEQTPLPTLEQIEQQIQDCEEELKALSCLRRAVKAAARAEEARTRRLSAKGDTQKAHLRAPSRQPMREGGKP
jgi:uncharacterized protein with von Willebrand factor type A (vWA) domain